MIKSRKFLQAHRALRNKSKLASTIRPRLLVTKTNKNIEAQLILDGKSVFGVSTKSKDAQKLKSEKKIEWLASEIVKKLVKANIKEITFDRHGFIFTGNIKKLADSLKAKGIII